ncbi:MAG: hypothetical protein VB085_11110 [Peptococcaceae bacterium]|nr:hypothetical protein [Peptococcaceae bacterium]
MGLFSEMLDEGRIRSSLQNSKNVLMITCPGCACESLSFSEDLPCRALEQGKDMEHSAIAVHRVRDRWDVALREMGIGVEHVSIAFPCEMFDTDRERIVQLAREKDTIAVLACGSGFIAIRDMFPDFKGKLVPMMRTAGTFVFRLVPDETGENSKVDQKTARVMRFSDKNKEKKGEVQ